MKKKQVRGMLLLATVAVVSSTATYAITSKADTTKTIFENDRVKVTYSEPIMEDSDYYTIKVHSKLQGDHLIVDTQGNLKETPVEGPTSKDYYIMNVIE